jgi:hypothetical protein
VLLSPAEVLRRVAPGKSRIADPLGPTVEESRAIDPATGWQLSPIAAASLCMTPRGMLTSAQAAKVEALKQASPSFIAMRQLAMGFRGILLGGGINKLDKWLDDAHRCGLSASHLA